MPRKIFVPPLETLRPRVVVVAPMLRNTARQLTTIRYDHHGQYFVDENVERVQQLKSLPQPDRRSLVIVQCPKFTFNVALVCCSHYCSEPCREHLEALHEKGWMKGGQQPLLAAKSTARRISSDE